MRQSLPCGVPDKYCLWKFLLLLKVHYISNYSEKNKSSRISLCKQCINLTELPSFISLAIGGIVHKHIYTLRPMKGTQANSEDPDQTP